MNVAVRRYVGSRRGECMIRKADWGCKGWLEIIASNTRRYGFRFNVGSSGGLLNMLGITTLLSNTNASPVTLRGLARLLSRSPYLVLLSSSVSLITVAQWNPGRPKSRCRHILGPFSRAHFTSCLLPPPPSWPCLLKSSDDAYCEPSIANTSTEESWVEFLHPFSACDEGRRNVC